MAIPDRTPLLRLELELMTFYPDEYVPKFVENIRDLYHYRSPLKQISFTQFSFDYLLNIVFEAAQSHARFRTLDCLRVLRAIKRDHTPAEFRFPPESVDKLFFIYKKFIAHQNEQVRWAVSVLLKDQVLSDWQVRWLIENCDENVSILNRVLRYPEPHPLLVEWASAAYQGKRHQNRQSEIIGLLIDQDIPSFVDLSRRSTIIWAIFQSRTTDEIRRKLLKTYWDIGSLDDLIEVCRRLSYPDVLEYVRQQVI